MPRLVGKKFNPTLSVLVGLLIAIAGAVTLEYFGVINFIPGFGKDPTTDNTSTNHPTQNGKSVN